MPQKVLNISLDYDGTANQDEVAFKELAKLLRRFGHNVYIVTMRFPSEITAWKDEWSNHVNAIFATARMAKREFMQARGINIDIWIDDIPETISAHAGQIWDNVTPEGQVEGLVDFKPDKKLIIVGETKLP